MEPIHPYEILLAHCYEHDIDLGDLPAELDAPCYAYATEAGEPVPQFYWPGTESIIKALASVCYCEKHWLAAYAKYNWLKGAQQLCH